VAGKSTLNRLEHTPRRDAGKYHKIDYHAPSLEALFVDIFLDAHKRPPKEIVLDLDATDDPIHGQQEGRFFHGYYDCYCYLPLERECFGIEFQIDFPGQIGLHVDLAPGILFRARDASDRGLGFDLNRRLLVWALAESME